MKPPTFGALAYATSLTERSPVLRYLIRHRSALVDLVAIILVMTLGVYLAFEFDFYPNPELGYREPAIEWDEVGTLGGVLAVSMLIFSHRRYQERQAEMRRRLVAIDELRESERRFSRLLENVHLASVMLDLNRRITYCNDFFLRLSGWKLQELLGRDWFEVFLPPELGDMTPLFQALLLDQPEAWHTQSEVMCRDGSRRLIRWSNTVLHAADGSVSGSASIGEDITERSHQESRIGRLLRTQQMLSNVNQLIVRQRNRPLLLQEACRIVADSGGFAVTWIGLVGQDGLLKPSGYAGKDDGFLDLVSASLVARRPAPSTQAVTSGLPYVCNDIHNDPLMLSWRNEASARGIRSLAAIPLVGEQVTVGCLVIYSGELNLFDEEEMHLLRDLANDISYALEFITRDEQLDYLVYYDPLTRLANRTLFRDRLSDLLMVAHHHRSSLAVATVDLTRFKAINDMVFRSGGNEVLRKVGERLTAFTGNPHLVARVEGDRFMFAMVDVGDSLDVADVLRERFWPLWDPPMEVMGLELRVTVRIGIAMSDGLDADALLRQAEAALKFAKSTGEQQQFYLGGMGEASAETLAFEWRVRQAVESEEFMLFYQPKVCLATGRICGAEALLRWKAHDLGWVSPVKFVPPLEETGLILEVGRWALAQASSDHRGWVEMGLPPLRVAVNVSALQLKQHDFVDMVTEAIQLKGRVDSDIELEVTESMLMTDIEKTIQKLHHLRSLGVSIAIDDFGTGYSSLAYLARLPAASIKIDRSFVIKMIESPETMAIVSSIVSLAHSLKLKVVAEGVETKAQIDVLRQLRCDEIQGYVFSPAVPAAEFAAMVQMRRSL